jgi:hypothetical protein
MNDVQFYREQLEMQKKIWDAQKKAFEVMFDAIKRQVEEDSRRGPLTHEQWAEKQDEQPD